MSASSKRVRVRKVRALITNRDKVTTAGEVCGASLVAFGVGLFCVAAGVITAGVLLAVLCRMFAEAP